MRTTKSFLLFILSVVLSGSSFAANRYWIGAGNWNIGLNWSASSGGFPCGCKPGAGDTAIFDAGIFLIGSGNCTIDAPVTVASIIVKSGYTKTISQGAYSINVSGAASFGGGTFAGGSSDITIAGAFTVSGTAFTSTSALLELDGDAAFTGGSFTPNNGQVKFNGSASQTISGAGAAFYNLEFNNSGSGIQLMNNITVANTLTMTQGNINLGGNKLTLGISSANNGTLSYSSGILYGAGSFTRWFKATPIADGSAAGLFPMGTASDYRPFYVSAPTVNPVSGGTITVAYHDAATNTNLPNYSDGALMILERKDLNWAVSSGGGLSGGTYNLDARGTGFGMAGPISDLRLTLANSVAGLPGTNAGTISDPQINRTNVPLSALTNSFYIGSLGTASLLPVTLISFTASVVNGEVELNWSAAAEIDNDYFVIQKSTDAIHWKNIERINSAGGHCAGESYSGYDHNPEAGISNYRLVQTDPDGKQTYSEIRTVRFDGKLPGISIYPNPATGYISIRFPPTGKYEVSLLNSSGQPITTALPGAGGSNIALPVSDRAAGVYFIQIRSGNRNETRKIIIEK